MAQASMAIGGEKQIAWKIFKRAWRGLTASRSALARGLETRRSRKALEEKISGALSEHFLGDLRDHGVI